MGMFDTMIDAEGREWQTKAFDHNLDVWQVGDTIPADCAASFQVEILHAPGTRLIESLGYALATVRGSVLTAVPDERRPELPMLNYSGRLIATAHSDRAHGGLSGEAGA